MNKPRLVLVPPFGDASHWDQRPRRILVFGATGYIGRHVVRELLARGHDVVAFARARAGAGGEHHRDQTAAMFPGAEVRFGDVTDPASVADDAFRGERFDAVYSCLASRSGAPDDAWRIDHDANQHVLAQAKVTGVEHFVLLSAICVQKPKLAFQRAKLAFEASLQRSGLRYAIVRPTAFFKSLSGQIERLKRGKPFLLFGSGQLTACRPISETDLAVFMADCIEDPAMGNAILPIGGPGQALTPIAQGELLFVLLDKTPRFKRVPVALLDVIISVLSVLGVFSRRLRDKAELARIGRYYATESMLVWDAEAGRYDADATPITGHQTLQGHYARVLDEGLDGQELGEHAVFQRRRVSSGR
jgi:divinyl chlorophyllide a 8-vinyl-reductase